MKFLLVTVLCFSAQIAFAQQTWTQWRGPYRDGHVAQANWPDSLDETHLVRLWRAPAGQSYSGPIVDESKVYITESRNRKTEVVRALDRKTGAEVWSHEWEGAMDVPFFAKANGDWIRSTPATDGERLFVAGMRDVLVCLDNATGTELWRFDFPKKTNSPLPSFGFVCSPLVHNGAVYVQAGGGFARLNAKTGVLDWLVLKDGGGMFGSAFSSPTLFEHDGKQQILVQTRTELTAVDDVTGTVYWKQEIPAFRGMNILTPTVWNESVLTSSYGGATWLFEPPAETGQPTELWKNRVEGYMSSPVIVGDHAYFHLKNERATCIDLKTGKATWTTKPLGKYWSMVTDGEKILALTAAGDLLLFKADPGQFSILSQRKVADVDSWAHVAIAGDQIFIRDLEGVSCYQWK